MMPPTDQTTTAAAPTGKSVSPVEAEVARIEAETKRVSARGEALARLREPLKAVIAVIVEYPELFEVVEAEVEFAKGCSAPTATGVASAAVASGPDPKDEALTNPDRMVAFFLRQSNRAATVSDICRGTGIPRSSVKNVLYVKKNDKTRFKRETEVEPVYWKLCDPEGEKERLSS